jgi:L-alanine-DL-glutamate epimerase-like enolase superfamily enzyme
MKAGDATHTHEQALIERVEIVAYEVPTDAPESDGTLAWSSTTLVVALVQAQGVEGMGYGYADVCTAQLCQGKLASVLAKQDAWCTAQRWRDMQRSLRNLGTHGIGAMAISILDTALWDWKARRLGLPLSVLIGPCQADVPAYGSGGFTSYDDECLARQLGHWAEQGLPAVKMKIGREPAQDLQRVRLARAAIGGDVGLMVDANGAYDVKQALRQAEAFADARVTWFEEPVSSDDLQGLALLRGRAPACMDIAAGEYGYDARYFQRMLAQGAVDVLQADATRCGGVTGFMQAAALCEAFGRPLSSHCAPALHAHLLVCAPTALHLEYFHDHVRIEQMLFDGGPRLHHGRLSPDLNRPGLGLSLKREESQCFKVA